MLLAIDIGNSNIKFGLFEQYADASEDEDFAPVIRVKLPTKQPHSGLGLYETLRAYMKMSSITAVMYSSVVPSVNAHIIELCGHLDVPFLELNAQQKIPITSLGEKPILLGADLLANAIASHYLYEGNKIIITFGTALTFVSLDKNGDVKGCAFSSGLGTSFRSLVKDAALLNDIELKKPKSANGQTTEEALQAGFIFGYQGMCGHIASKMAQIFEDNEKTQHIVTGYEAKLIDLELKNMQFNRHLTLKGLYFAAKDNKLIP